MLTLYVALSFALKAEQNQTNEISLIESTDRYQSKLLNDINLYKHEGVATCASSVCHGSPIERGNSNILQNEYIIWENEDPHAQAYKVLLNKQSQKIAKNLGIEQAHKAKICLDCHTDNVAQEKRGEKFLLSDGVGCEACHGGAEKWIASHTNGNHQQALANGLSAIDNSVNKAELCLSCHFGNSEKFATHDIMGAGHPRLKFELETYSALQPYHHVVDNDYKERKQADDGAKTWAIGQISLAKSMLKVLQQDKFIHKGLLPELALFDCHACHTPMNAGKWQPRVSSRGLGPGKIRLNDSSLVMLQFMMQAFLPEQAKASLDLIRQLHLASQSNKVQLQIVATELTRKVDLLLSEINQLAINEDSLIKIRNDILTEGAAGGFLDYLSAEQSAMTIDLLSRRIDLQQYQKISRALDNLFETIVDENKFKHKKFSQAMKTILQQL
jgi:hypothetical protein